MFSCNHCGSSVPKNKAFCPNCGTKIHNEAAAAHEEKQYKTAPKKPSKRTVLLIAGALSLLIVAGAAHLVLSSVYKPEKAIMNFEKAVDGRDYEMLASLLHEGGTDADFNSEDVKGFVSYLTEENDFGEIKKSLTGEYRKAKNGMNAKPVTDDHGNKILKIVEKEKKFFLYKQFAIQAVPFKIEAASNYDNVIVSVNGKTQKKLGKAEEPAEVGAFLPGEYNINASYKGEYSDLDTAMVLTPAESFENKLEAYISLDGSHLSFYSNRSDATVYINGKSTEKTIEQIEGLGPVTLDGAMKIYAVAEGEGGPIKSNVVSIESSDVELWFEEEVYEEEEWADSGESQMVSYSHNDLEGFMQSYLAASIDAINYRDFSYVADYHHPDGSTYKESKEYIPYLDSKGITEELIAAQLVDSTEMKDGYSLTMNEEYNIFYTDSPTKRKRFKSQYIVKWNSDGELKVFKLNSTDELSSTEL